MYGVRIEEVRQVLAVETIGRRGRRGAGRGTRQHGPSGSGGPTYLQDGTLVEVAFNQHPADRFRYELTLRKTRLMRALTYPNILTMVGQV